MFRNILWIIIVLSLSQCKKPIEENIKKVILSKNEPTDSLHFPKTFFVDGFDFPVGKPNAQGYYNAQKFGENNHLGEDWNANTGGNTDLGDSIYAIANGYIVETRDYKGGWGKVIRIIHKMPDNHYLESLYAHCDSITVSNNIFVKKGQKIGTIGTADGRYLAHLHLELRNQINMPLGKGYDDNKEGYINPTQFINKNRKVNKIH
ncbi:MAG: M23 family metallopeptidase [Flavobacteriales bacterium]